MKGRNPIVLVLVLVVFLGLGAIVFFSLNGDSKIEISGKGAEDVQKPVALSTQNLDGDRLPQEFKRLVVDLGDMQSRMDELNSKISSLEKENLALKNSDSKKEVERSLNKPDEQIFPLPVLTEIVNSTAPVRSVASDAATNLKGFVQSPLSPEPVSLNKPNASTLSSSSQTLVWLEPMDSGFIQDKSSKNKRSTGSSSQPSMLSDLDQNPLNVNESPSFLDETTSKAMTKAGLETAVDPRFTIPDGSIITESMSVTAMVGRIPVNGKITDPWRFKISTGVNIVMPNDQEIQGLEKTIIQGDAVGDLNLMCVSGRIDTITFIFSDGRIVTHKSKGGSKGGLSGGGSDKSLGYISDQFANPCIPGRLITNAPQAISQMGLLGVAAGMADGIAEAETQTTVTDRGSVIKNVVGDQLTYAGYKGVATGINDVRSWFSQRMGQYFDVIYVKAGQIVDVHITQEIKIDYDPMGRKVRYEKTDANSFGYMD